MCVSLWLFFHLFVVIVCIFAVLLHLFCSKCASLCGWFVSLCGCLLLLHGRLTSICVHCVSTFHHIAYLCGQYSSQSGIYHSRPSSNRGSLLGTDQGAHEWSPVPLGLCPGGPFSNHPVHPASVICLFPSLLLPPSPLLWLAPIKKSLEVAELSDTFRSHKASQSTNSHQTETLQAPIWRRPQWSWEFKCNKVVLDRAAGMNGKAAEDLCLKRPWERERGGGLGRRCNYVLWQNWGNQSKQFGGIESGCRRPEAVANICQWQRGGVQLTDFIGFNPQLQEMQ